MLLPEDHIPLRTMKSAPGPDAPFERPAQSGPEFGVAAKERLKDRHSPDAGSGFEHRHDLAVPDRGKRVGTAAPARPLLLGRQPWVGFDPVGGGRGKSGLGGSHGRSVD